MFESFDFFFVFMVEHMSGNHGYLGSFQTLGPSQRVWHTGHNKSRWTHNRKCCGRKHAEDQGAIWNAGFEPYMDHGWQKTVCERGGDGNGDCGGSVGSGVPGLEAWRTWCDHGKCGFWLVGNGSNTPYHALNDPARNNDPDRFPGGRIQICWNDGVAGRGKYCRRAGYALEGMWCQEGGQIVGGKVQDTSGPAGGMRAAVDRECGADWVHSVETLDPSRKRGLCPDLWKAEMPGICLPGLYCHTNFNERKGVCRRSATTNQVCTYNAMCASMVQKEPCARDATDTRCVEHWASVGDVTGPDLDDGGRGAGYCARHLGTDRACTQSKVCRHPHSNDCGDDSWCQLNSECPSNAECSNWTVGQRNACRLKDNVTDRTNGEYCTSSRHCGSSGTCSGFACQGADKRPSCTEPNAFDCETSTTCNQNSDCQSANCDRSSKFVCRKPKTTKNRGNGEYCGGEVAASTTAPATTAPATTGTPGTTGTTTPATAAAGPSTGDCVADGDCCASPGRCVNRACTGVPAPDTSSTNSPTTTAGGGTSTASGGGTDGGRNSSASGGDGGDGGGGGASNEGNDSEDTSDKQTVTEQVEELINEYPLEIGVAMAMIVGLVILRKGRRR